MGGRFMPTKTKQNAKQKRAKKTPAKQETPENEVQPSRRTDATVGLGDGLEGAPIEEYEEELELGTEKASHKSGS
jgi:hypothetical protein